VAANIAREVSFESSAEFQKRLPMLKQSIDAAIEELLDWG
jgi:hypothetical protein